MKARRRNILLILSIIALPIIFLPLVSFSGDKPTMTHAFFNENIAPLIEQYEIEIEEEDRPHLIQLNFDLRTGLHGTSLFGAEIQIGSHSVYTMTVTKNDFDDFYYDGTSLWLGSEDFAKFTEVMKKQKKR